ncbi:hypothetical protein ACWCWQ_18495 [Streptomyces sp. NPDC001571]
MWASRARATLPAGDEEERKGDRAYRDLKRVMAKAGLPTDGMYREAFRINGEVVHEFNLGTMSIGTAQKLCRLLNIATRLRRRIEKRGAK